MRQVLDSGVALRAEGIPRILPLGDRSNLKSLGKFGRQVFQRMHSQIDAPLRQRLLDLFGEHSLGSDLGERNIGDFIAGCVNDLDLDFMSASPEQRRNVISLPEGKLRAARTDSEFCRMSAAGWGHRW